MARNNKQTGLKSTEETNVEMRRSFSWDRAFFTNDGFLDADELSSMIEGSVDDENQQLQKIEEIESLEAKLSQEIEASTQRSNAKKNSQANQVKAASNAPSSSSTPVKTPSSGGPRGKKVKSPTRITGSKTRNAEGERSNGIKKRNDVAPVSTRMLRTPLASPGSSGSSKSTFTVNQRSKRSSSVPRRSSMNSEKPVGKTPKNKVVAVNTRMSSTPPSSPGSSSGSTKSTFSVSQRSKRSSSVPRRSSVNNEKPSARRDDERESSKPAVRLIPKTQSSIGLKIKPPPVVSHPSSPSQLSESSPSSSTSASTCKVNQKSKPVGRSKSTLKHRPDGQTPDRNRKQPVANASKARNILALNTAAKQISQKTTTATKPSKKQTSVKANASSSTSKGAENVVLVSPEVMDIKGKLNALKMEISMQKERQMQGNNTF